MIPLGNREILMMKDLNELFRRIGIYGLDLREIRSSISHRFPNHTMKKKEFTRFLIQVGGRWFLLLQSSAFGVERIFFHFEINNQNKRNGPIDFKNSENTLLTISDVFKSVTSPNLFMGVMYVPNNDLERIVSFMNASDKNKEIKLKSISRIKTTHKSISLKDYEPNEGWTKLSSTQLKRRFKLSQNRNLDNKDGIDSYLYITPSLNLDWKYSDHKLPSQLIKLYCKIPAEYSYPNLPLEIQKGESNTKLSNNERGLLKLLPKKNVVQLGFIPWEIIYEFSLTRYLLIFPKTSLPKLNWCLELVPYCDIDITNENVLLWTRLTSNYVKWIKKNIDCIIHPISRLHFPSPVKFEWFDNNKNQWKTPEIIND